MATDRGRNSFDLDRLREGLAPFRLHFFTSLRSTNDHAAAMRRRGELFAPAVVLGARQTAGRGRGANTWFSAPGSLTVTFVLAADPMLAAHHVPLAAGLAVRNAAAAIAGCDPIGLKWPNDLVVSGSGTKKSPGKLLKLAGLLCERLDNVDLIGVGLNVNRPEEPLPPDLASRVVYLRDLVPAPASCQSGAMSTRAPSALQTKASSVARAGISSREMRRSPCPPEPQPAPQVRRIARGSCGHGTNTPLFSLTDVLIAIAHEIHQTLVRKNQTPFGLLRREYDQHHALLGRVLTVFAPHEPPIVGRCEGLDDTGRLLMRVGKRYVAIVAGHVEVRE